MLSNKLRWMDESETGKQRSERHAREVEASQKKLRANIAETKRLLTDSDKMLKRHRGECQPLTTKRCQPQIAQSDQAHTG